MELDVDESEISIPINGCWLLFDTKNIVSVIF